MPAVVSEVVENSIAKELEIEKGDILQFVTDYGTYEYEVTEIEVYNEDDLLDLLIEKTGYEEETEAVVLASESD